MLQQAALSYNDNITPCAQAHMHFVITNIVQNYLLDLQDFYKDTRFKMAAVSGFLSSDVIFAGIVCHSSAHQHRGVVSGRRRRRFARVNVNPFRTLLAFHFATPSEFTIALINAFDAYRVVATPTTHDVTSVWTT